jgi:TPR repeat protein
VNPSRSFPLLLTTLFLLALSLLVPILSANTTFPDYHQINNLVNALSPADIPALTQKAEAGAAASQIMLGLAYQNGHGVRENQSDAFGWYQKAAAQGNAMGENLLGFSYYVGIGIGRDDAQAVAWFRKAAAQSDYTAQDNLATVLKNGASLPKNTDEARAIVQKEGTAGGIEAQLALGLAYSGSPNRLGIHKDYELAANWLQKSSDAGSPIAQASLAALYFLGQGVPKDEAAGLQLLQKSSSTRFCDALFFLGEIYEQGRGVPKDKLTADMYYILAQDSGKEVFNQRHGNVFTGGIPIFIDHRITLADAQAARKLADEWIAEHPTVPSENKFATPN